MSVIEMLNDIIEEMKGLDTIEFESILGFTEKTVRLNDVVDIINDKIQGLIKQYPDKDIVFLIKDKIEESSKDAVCSDKDKRTTESKMRHEV